MLCQLPCIFLIVGIVWPMIMLFGDGCASGFNVGENVGSRCRPLLVCLCAALPRHLSLPARAPSPWQYLVSYGDPICPRMLHGSSGGLEACYYSLDQSLLSVDVHVNASVPIHPA